MGTCQIMKSILRGNIPFLRKVTPLISKDLHTFCKVNKKKSNGVEMQFEVKFSLSVSEED